MYFSFKLKYPLIKFIIAKLLMLALIFKEFNSNFQFIIDFLIFVNYFLYPFALTPSQTVTANPLCRLICLTSVLAINSTPQFEHFYLLINFLFRIIISLFLLLTITESTNRFLFL